MAFLIAINTAPDTAGGVVFAIAAVATIVAALIGNAKDQKHRVIMREYGLDAGEQARFERIETTFAALYGCGGKWYIQASGAIRDLMTWKRQAGASELVDRKTATFGDRLPGILRSNISPPSIKVGRQVLNFLPDTILVWDGSTFGAIAYGDLQMSCGNSRFIETSGVPHDARVVDQTWRFPNKKGGPDRRFSNNYQIPVCLYDEMFWASTSGVADGLLLLQAGRRPTLCRRYSYCANQWRSDHRGRRNPRPHRP